MPQTTVIQPQKNNYDDAGIWNGAIEMRSVVEGEPILRIEYLGKLTIAGCEVPETDVPARLAEIVRLSLGRAMSGLSSGLCKYVPMGNTATPEEPPEPGQIKFAMENSTVTIVEMGKENSYVMGRKLDLSLPADRSALFYGLLAWTVLAGSTPPAAEPFLAGVAKVEVESTGTPENEQPAA